MKSAPGPGPEGYCSLLISQNTVHCRWSNAHSYPLHLLWNISGLRLNCCFIITNHSPPGTKKPLFYLLKLMILIFSLEEHASPLSLSFFALNVTACPYELFFLLKWSKCQPFLRNKKTHLLPTNDSGSGVFKYSILEWGDMYHNMNSVIFNILQYMLVIIRNTIL